MATIATSRGGDAGTATMSDAVRRFLDTPRMAVVASINPDGSPLQAVAWYLFRGDTLVLNSRVGRTWPRNLLRDPRVDIAVHDGYDWVGLRGSVEVVDDPEQGQADIAEMARRYHADEPGKAEREIATFRTQRRISFLLRPTAIYEHFED